MKVSCDSVEGLASFPQGLGQGAAVDVFQFAAHRNAAGQTGQAQSERVQQGGDGMGGGFPLCRQIGRQDHFFQGGALNACHQAGQVDILRSDPVQRGEVSHENEIMALISQGLFHHQEIGGRFHHAQQARIAGLVLTQFAGRGGRVIVAVAALRDPIQGMHQGGEQLLGTAALALEQLIGHALCRPGADAG